MSLEQVPIDVLHQCLSYTDIKSMGILMSLNKDWKQLSSSYLLAIGLNHCALTQKTTVSSSGGRLNLKPSQYASIIASCTHCETINLFDMKSLFWDVDQYKISNPGDKRNENKKLLNSIVNLLKQNADRLQQVHLRLSHLDDDMVYNCLRYIPEQITGLSLKVKTINTTSKWFSLLKTFKNLLYLRLHSSTAGEYENGSPAVDGLLPLLPNLRAIDLKGTEFLFTNTFGEQTLIDLCPHLQEITVSRLCPMWNAAHFNSLEKKGMKITKLQVRNALEVKNEIQGTLNNPLVIFSNLRVLDLPQEISIPSIVDAIQFPRYLEEVSIGARFAVGHIGSLVLAASGLKKLSVSGEGHWINTLATAIAKSNVHTISLQSLTIEQANIAAEQIFYMMTVCNKLTRFTGKRLQMQGAIMKKATSSDPFTDAHTYDNPYSNIVVPLQKLELIQKGGSLSDYHLIQLLELCCSTIESVVMSNQEVHETSIYDMPYSAVVFPRWTNFQYDTCSAGGKVIRYLTRCKLNNLSKLSIQDGRWLNESELLALLGNTLSLSQFRGQGIECSDRTLHFLAQRNLILRELDLGGAITEDGLLALGEQMTNNLEGVSLMSTYLTDMDKVIQFVSRCPNLQILKINMGQLQYPTNQFFETLITTCPALKVVICGGKGAPDVDASTVEQFILSAKHLSVFVLDFCPKGMDRTTVISKCRQSSGRSAIPTVIVPTMTYRKNTTTSSSTYSCTLQ